MPLIVTRPAAQAGAWVDGLRRRGVDAVALPLIAIAPVADAAPLVRAWAGLAQQALVMFVSANAVLHFFDARPGAATWPAGTLAGCTGPGTRAALQRAGVPPEAIVEPDEGALDSEGLWQQLERRDWAGRRVLVVRGEDGRDWLAERLRERGATVEPLAAYARRAPRLDAAGHALLDAAVADPAAWCWLFSSSQAIAHLRSLRPAVDWSAGRALASHPRIAQAARDAGFGHVTICAPDADSVAALLLADAPAAPAAGGAPGDEPRQARGDGASGPSLQSPPP
jgi:uroporphyrinogen-III synthase